MAMFWSKSKANLAFIFVFCSHIFTIAEGDDTVLDLEMPAGWSASGHFYELDTGALSSFEFMFDGCGELRLSLLPAPDVFSNYTQLFIGDDEKFPGITVSHCWSRDSCEERNKTTEKLVYCYDFGRFWVDWTSTNLTVRGGFYGTPETVIVTYSPPPPPPPSSPREGNATDDPSVVVKSIVIENGNSRLNLMLRRNSGANYCFVTEREKENLTQCGDNFADMNRCLDCQCCYDASRQPACYRSMVATGNNSDNHCVRSISDLLPHLNIFASGVDVYVNETVEFLVVSGTFDPRDLRFEVDFGDGSERLDNFTRNETLPTWMTDPAGRSRPAAVEEQGLYRRTLAHVYREEVGSITVALKVSGQMNSNRTVTSSWTKTVRIEVRRRPTLEQALNGTLLASCRPVYRRQLHWFIYVVGRPQSGLSYMIDFEAGNSTGQSLTPRRLNATDVVEMEDGRTLVEDGGGGIEWETVLAGGGGYWGGNLTYRFDSLGTYLVNLTVSGSLPVVGGHDAVVRSIALRVIPTLEDVTGPLLFISRTPAYVGRDVEFLFLVRNHFDSLSYRLDFGDGSASQEMNFTGPVRNASLPDWVRKRYYKPHGVESGVAAERILSSSGRYNGSLLAHVFGSTGRFQVRIRVSGLVEAVERVADIRLENIVDVIEKRRTLADVLETIVLLSSESNYVNESTYLLYRFGDFSDGLNVSVDFGDGTGDSDLSVTGYATVPSWVRQGRYLTLDLNRTKVEEIFRVHIIDDSFIGGVVEHAYSETGTYDVTFTVRGVLNGTYDELNRSTVASVRLRPTLSEVLGRVLVFVRSPVYDDVNTTFLILIENAQNAASYQLDFGDDSSTEMTLIEKQISVPAWVYSRQYTCQETNATVVNEFLANGSNYSGAIVEHVYETPGKNQAIFSVFGWMESLGSDDRKLEINVSVDVIMRPKLSEALRFHKILVSEPTTANEIIHFLYVSNESIPDLTLQVDFGDESGWQEMAILPRNDEVLAWLAKLNLSSSLDTLLSNYNDPNINATIAYASHTYASSNRSNPLVRFAASTKSHAPMDLDPISLTIGEPPLNTTSGHVTMEIHPSSSSTPFAWTLWPPLTFNPGNSAPVVVVTGGGTWSKSPAKFFRNESFQLEAHVVNGNGGFRAKDEGEEGEEEVQWKWFRLPEAGRDSVLELWIPNVFVRANVIRISQYTLDYGTYKIQAKVVKGDREFVGHAYVSIMTSPLKVKIIGSPVITTDSETPLAIYAEADDDVDEPRDLNRLGFRYEWYCMLEGETSPLSADQTAPLSGDSGCYGNGRKQKVTTESFYLNVKFLHYKNLPSFVIVQVALTKDPRRRAVASQTIMVTHPVNPLTIRCSSNCGFHLDPAKDLVLKAICEACGRGSDPVGYEWILHPLCPQNVVRNVIWNLDAAVTKGKRPGLLRIRRSVFRSSPGDEPYQVTLIATLRNGKKVQALYQFLTQRQTSNTTMALSGRPLESDAACLKDSKNSFKKNMLKFLFLLLVVTVCNRN